MSRYFLWLIVGAFLIRVSYVVFFNLADLEERIAIDNDGYLERTVLFQEGNFLFSETHTERMPLIPVLTAFWSSLFPFFSPKIVFQFWNILLDLCTLISIYLFVRYLFDERSAFAAGVLYAVYPLAVYRLPLMNSEVIQGTALAFWVVGMVRVIHDLRVGPVLCLSFLTSVVLYITPAFQFVPIFVIVLLFVLSSFKRAVSLGILYILPILFLVLLWGMRNEAVLGDFYLFDSRGGQEFWIGNHQESEGRWEGEKRHLWEEKLHRYAEQVSKKGGNRHDYNFFMYKKGLEEILENPGSALVLFGKKFLRFWFVPASETMLDKTIPLQSLYLVLCCIGIYYGRRRIKEISIPLFIIVYFCGIYTLSYACIRFSHPIMPWICALGGVGLIALQDRIYRMRT